MNTESINSVLGLFVCTILFAGSISVLTAQDQAENETEPEMVDVNFSEGVALKDLISFVSKMTENRFQYDPSVVKGKVNVLSEKKVPKTSLLPLLLSVLKSKNLTAVKEGFGEDEQTIWKIKKANVQGSINQVVEGTDLPENDQIVSKVFRLEHVNAGQAQQVISRLVTEGSGGAKGIKSVNALLVTDYATNIEKISDVIGLMDQPTEPPQVKVVELDNVSASEAQETLKSLIPGAIGLDRTGEGDGNAMPEDTKIMVHPTKNALILMTGPEHVEKVISLVKKLDRKGKQEPSRVHIYQLNNTDAKPVANKVQSLYQDKLSPEDLLKENKGEDKKKQGKVLSIKAIESQNALIVSASERMWENQVRPLLDRIDTKRSQVLISATIVEVTGEMNQEVGVDFASVSPDENLAFSTTGITTDQLIDTNGDDVADTFRPGGSQLAQGAIVGRFLQDRQEIFVLSKLFRKDQIINISQLPYVVARDNKEATLAVKNEVPFQETTALEGGQTQENVQFEEAGLEINITPQITEENYLRMDVLAKFNEFQGQSSENLPPQKTIRELETGLTVPNRNTVVMGGLSSRVEDETSTGIPFLKEIPYAGQVFRQDSVTDRKTTLYLFITPYILRDRRFRDYRGISREKKQGAKRLTGLDFGESDSMVGPSGSLDSFTLDSPYSEGSRDVADKYDKLFDVSQELRPPTSNE